ncbi:MAG: DUF2889 domain-containing protein [Actinobacteria bacterium]|uniref:Unannotated protein n=1 Tax=freshwater metagenome TaxID=449393 RepID=A0A6J7RAN1_9ZZZZ|nr:DUF2889 domain-containing protein [Actinomycetota bacterium]
MTRPTEATNLFAEPDLPRLHTRDYDVRAYRRDDTTMLIRGGVRDVLPAGFYDDADTEPLTMHHMVVDLVVDTATLEILEATVLFEQHPHPACPNIVDHYGRLVGLSIARGFTHRIRELFGGPRGCSHTTALLQAMAPVAMQAFLGSRIIQSTPSTGNSFGANMSSPEGRAARAEGNRNTCHVWSDDGEYLESIRTTGAIMLPIPISRRLRDRGIDPDAWQAAAGTTPPTHSNDEE